MKSTIK